ncbi:hypothetical protein MKX03_028338, partial [Papaver bracteatum]
MEKLEEDGSPDLVHGAVETDKYNKEMMMKKERSLNKGGMYSVTDVEGYEDLERE